MAPLFSVILRKAKAAVRLKHSAMRDNGLWYYLREDLVGKTQMEVPLKLHQMEARVDGKTFLVQRSFKPLAFPIGNSNKFAFKVSQFGIPIADVNPIADEGSNFEDNSLVVELIDRGTLSIQNISLLFLGTKTPWTCQISFLGR